MRFVPRMGSKPAYPLCNFGTRVPTGSEGSRTYKCGLSGLSRMALATWSIARSVLPRKALTNPLAYHAVVRFGLSARHDRSAFRPLPGHQSRKRAQARRCRVRLRHPFPISLRALPATMRSQRPWKAIDKSRARIAPAFPGCGISSWSQPEGPKGDPVGSF
jgi:hypothetical protein